jgi:glycosyltransferase involved in cell wall biosynthesis
MISVIIPAYNQAQYLKQAIDSALSQEGVILEVIVIDDGSQDETPELLKEYKNRIHALRHENQGAAGARNSGLDISSGQFIAFLDADDRWLPGHLAGSMEVFSNEPEVGLTYSDARVIDEEGRFEKYRVSPRKASLESLVLGNYITTSSVVLRKGCLEKCGKFDTGFRYTSQDWDMWMRIAAKYQFRHTGHALAEYRRHSQSAIQTLGFRIRDSSLMAVQKAFERDPGLPSSLKSRAEAAVYLESAVRCLAALEPGPARRELWNGLKRHPWIPRAIPLLGLSLLGKTGLEMTLRLRRGSINGKQEPPSGDAQ